MKKIFILVILISVCFLFFGQESEEKVIKNGYENFLEKYIGKEITIIVKDFDIPLTGRLIALYKEGIVIETSAFKQRIFIFNNFIILIKIKTKE